MNIQEQLAELKYLLRNEVPYRRQFIYENELPDWMYDLSQDDIIDLMLLANKFPTTEQGAFLEKICGIMPKILNYQDNDDAGLEISRNTLWKQHHRMILAKMVDYIDKNAVVPSKAELARLTGLSRYTVYKHFKDLTQTPMFKENRENFVILETEVMTRVFNQAMRGSLPASRLFLQMSPRFKNETGVSAESPDRALRGGQTADEHGSGSGVPRGRLVLAAESPGYIPDEKRDFSRIYQYITDEDFILQATSDQGNHAIAETLLHSIWDQISQDEVGVLDNDEFAAIICVWIKRIMELEGQPRQELMHKIWATLDPATHLRIEDLISRQDECLKKKGEHPDYQDQPVRSDHTTDTPVEGDVGEVMSSVNPKSVPVTIGIRNPQPKLNRKARRAAEREQKKQLKKANRVNATAYIGTSK